MKLGVAGLLIGAVASMGLLGGCETLVNTPGESLNQVGHAMVTDLKQIPDDTAYILLVDRPSWLSNKPIPNTSNSNYYPSANTR